MSYKQVRWVWVLIGWTAFLWLSRLRNVLANNELTSAGRAVRVGVVVIFVALAAMATVAVRTDRNRIAVLRTFLVWTVGYWLIRGFGILIDGDYSAGFKAVHTVLMVVTLTLAAMSARQEAGVASPQR